jgi:hypothetical protein
VSCQDKITECPPVACQYPEQEAGKCCPVCKAHIMTITNSAIIYFIRSDIKLNHTSLIQGGIPEIELSKL